MYILFARYLKAPTLFSSTRYNRIDILLKQNPHVTRNISYTIVSTANVSSQDIVGVSRGAGLEDSSHARSRRIILASFDTTWRLRALQDQFSRQTCKLLASPVESAGIPRSMSGRRKNVAVGNNFWVRGDKTAEC